MLRCIDVAARADRLIEGSLPAGQRLAVLLHLSMCVKCRRFMRRMRQMLGNIAALRREDVVPDTLIERIGERLQLPAQGCKCTEHRPDLH